MSEEFKPTQDVPEAEAKAEGQKLEWGPFLGEMCLFSALDKIVKLNKDLTKGKQWKMPTRDELVAEFNKTG